MLAGVAGTALVSGVGALVWLLWTLNTLVAKQNGSLAHVIEQQGLARADMEEHRKEDREDFGKVHGRIDDVLALLP